MSMISMIHGLGQAGWLLWACSHAGTMPVDDLPRHAAAVQEAPAAAASVTDWRAFRGTDSRGHSSVAAPREWSDETNIVWKTELPGPGSSSPIVVGDVVFVTCWSGYGLDRESPGKLADLRRHLLCVDRETGSVRWTATVEPVPTEDTFDGRMSTHGYASSTPVSDGTHVFVHFGKSGVFAYDLAGRRLWHRSVGTGSSQWKTGSGSSLALSGDLLFVNASDESHSLHALDRKTGAEVWKRSTEALDQAYGTPLLVGEDPSTRVLVLALLGEIWGLDPATGKPRFTVTTGTNGSLAPSVVAGHDDQIVYSFGGQTKNRSFAVRLGGAGDVTATHTVWATTHGDYVSTPLYSDGHLYWLSDAGVACCTNAATGELVYRQRLRGRFYSSPVRAGDAIYAVSREGGTYVYAATPEFELFARNRIESDDSVFDGTPAFSDGRLFLRSSRYLYCIGE